MIPLRLHRLRFLGMLIAGAIAPVASAHQLDEYLQATLVAIEPGDIRLQINLTPGVEIAGLVIDLIDLDHDGVITPQEGESYAALFRRDLSASLDGRSVPLTLASSRFPEPAELRTGDGIIQLEFCLPSSGMTAASHRLTLENRHLPQASIYLLNAAKPKSGFIRISRQTRNDDQSRGEIEFVSTAPPLDPAPDNRKVPVALLAAAAFSVAATAWILRGKGQRNPGAPDR